MQNLSSKNLIILALLATTACSQTKTSEGEFDSNSLNAAALDTCESVIAETCASSNATTNTDGVLVVNNVAFTSFGNREQSCPNPNALCDFAKPLGAASSELLQQYAQGNIFGPGDAASIYNRYGVPTQEADVLGERANAFLNAYGKDLLAQTQTGLASVVGNQPNTLTIICGKTATSDVKVTDPGTTVQQPGNQDILNRRGLPSGFSNLATKSVENGAVVFQHRQLWATGYGKNNEDACNAAKVAVQDLSNFDAGVANTNARNLCPPGLVFIQSEYTFGVPFCG